MTDKESINPYMLDGEPQLCDSAVLFLDLLGSRDASRSSDPQQILRRLYPAIKRAHAVGLERDADVVPQVVTFTDNVVVAWPVTHALEHESAIGSVLFMASYYQWELTRHGFFVRGGLAFGSLFVDTDFVYGPALDEAYSLEQTCAIYPRVVLSDGVVEMIGDFLADDDAATSWENGALLRCADERLALNYLDVVAEDDPEIAHDWLIEHKNRVEEALRTHAKDMRVWEKYRWLADYHDYFCASRFPEYPDLLISPSPANQLTRARFSTIEEVIAQR